MLTQTATKTASTLKEELEGHSLGGKVGGSKETNILSDSQYNRYTDPQECSDGEKKLLMVQMKK